jgi:DNA-binding ferritin-like protein
MNNLHILTLAAWLANVHLAHWQADTRTTAHQTLGALYDGFDSFLDELAEVNMGKTGITDFPAGHFIIFLPNADLGELMQFGLSEVAAIREECDTLNKELSRINADLLKILDEMQALINRTKFLLKV